MLLIVPTAVFELLHVPPLVVLFSVVATVGHTVALPVIAAGAVNTDAVIVLENTGLAVTHPRLLIILHDTVCPLASVLTE